MTGRDDGMTTDTSTIWLSQAHDLLTRGDLPAASVLFGRICGSDPGRCYAWKMHGALNAQLGKIDEAVDCLRYVVALEPELAEGYYNLGNMLKMQDAPDESLV